MSKKIVFILVVTLFLQTAFALNVREDSMGRPLYAADRIKVKLSEVATEKLNFVLSNNGDFTNTGLIDLDYLLKSIGVSKIILAHRPVLDKIWEQEKGFNRWYLFFVPVETDIERTISEMSNNDYIESASPEVIYYLSVTPNDPYFDDCWGHDNTSSNGPGSGHIVGFDSHIEEAWDDEQGYGSTSVIIAILDSGVDYNHEDLNDNCVTGYDYGDGDSDPMDDSANEGHGTCCAGIAAGEVNNAIGVSGVAGDCSIMPLKVANSSGTLLSTAIINALTHCGDNDVNVASMSFSSDTEQGDYPAFDDAIAYAYNHGVTLLAATANDDYSHIHNPANDEHVIAVGAASPCAERKRLSSCDGENWWGSNYGVVTQDARDAVDVIAPTILPATDVTGSNGYSTGNYISNFNGTSCATPYAAGIAALLISKNTLLTPAQVKSYLTSTATDVVDEQPTPGWDRYTGYGMVNADAAVGAVPGSGFDPPTNLTATVVNDDDVDLEWDAPLTEAILWDQIDPEGETYGKAAQDFGASYPTYYCEVAGDFVLTEEVTLTAARFVFFYSAAHTNPCPFNVGIFPDMGGYPGETALYTTSTNSAMPDVNNVFTIEFYTPIVLSAGTYWIGYNIILDYAVYGTQGYANMRTTLDNATAGYWRNPGDGFATGFTTWTQDVKNDLDEPRDLAYQILGNYGSRSEEIVNHNFNKQSSIASQNIFSKAHNADNLQKPIISASNEDISNYDYSNYSNTRNTRSLSGYKIYRNLFLLHTISDPGTTTYTDLNLPDGDYSYYVTSTYSSPDGESVHSNTADVTIGIPAETEISYHYGTAAYFWNCPDTYGDYEFGVRFTPLANCDLNSTNISFYNYVGTPAGIYVNVYSCVDNYPDTLLGTVTVDFADINFGIGTWTNVDLSSLTRNLSFNAYEDFFITYSTIDGIFETTQVNILSDNGETAEIRSIENYGTWGYMNDDWGDNYEFFMTANVEYESIPEIHDYEVSSLTFYGFFLPTETRANIDFEADIFNNGTFDETDVEIELVVTDTTYSRTVVYSNSQYISLTSETGGTVYFDTWSVSTPGEYIVTVTSKLTGDNESNNDMIDLEQQVCSYPTELTYDDGTAESAWVKNAAGNGFANKFTPPYIPYSISDISFHVWDDTWPDPGSNEMKIMILDDDGTDGSPGTILYEEIVTVVRDAWNVFDLGSRNILLEDGSFYVASISTADYPYCPGQSVDNSGPFAGQNIAWDLQDGVWVQGYASFGDEYMIRASVDAGSIDPPIVAIDIINAGADVELTWDPVPGANSYNVYSSLDPYGVFTIEPLGTAITSTNWNESTSEKKFYYVTASTDVPSRNFNNSVKSVIIRSNPVIKELGNDVKSLDILQKIGALKRVR